MQVETKFSLNQIVHVISRISGVWHVTDTDAKIGKVKVELYADDYNTNGYNNGVYYMTDKTGVGCGVVINEANIFVDYADAKSECDKRNKLLLTR